MPIKHTGQRVYLRYYDVADAQAKLSLLIRNKDLFQQYLYPQDDSYYTLGAQISLIKREEAERAEDKKYSFGIFLLETNELIGNISFSEIERGPLQTCMIGYWLDQRFNGQGYMTEAVDLALKIGFGELHFHRIEAGVMPRNQRSARVLEKSGFQREGLNRKNVKINGKWEDHLLFAILDEDVNPAASS